GKRDYVHNITLSMNSMIDYIQTNDMTTTGIQDRETQTRRDNTHGKVIRKLAAKGLLDYFKELDGRQRVFYWISKLGWIYLMKVSSFQPQSVLIDCMKNPQSPFYETLVYNLLLRPHFTKKTLLGLQWEGTHAIIGEYLRRCSNEIAGI